MMGLRLRGRGAVDARRQGRPALCWRRAAGISGTGARGIRLRTCTCSSQHQTEASLGAGVICLRMRCVGPTLRLVPTWTRLVLRAAPRRCPAHARRCSTGRLLAPAPVHDAGACRVFPFVPFRIAPSGPLVGPAQTASCHHHHHPAMPQLLLHDLTRGSCVCAPLNKRPSPLPAAPAPGPFWRSVV